MKAKMIAKHVAWCRHFGKNGRDGDRERRSIKRGKANDWKRAARKDQL